MLLQLYDLPGCESEGPVPDEPSSYRADGVIRRESLIGEVRADLFADNPEMPTLQSMHKLVARHPTLQANFFLLMEQLVITELLCIQGAFIGKVNMDSFDPPIESQNAWEPWSRRVDGLVVCQAGILQ